MKKIRFYATILFFLSIFTDSFSATFWTRTSGNWNSTSTWTTAGPCSSTTASSIPGSSDSVVICNTRTVNVTADANAKSVTISSGGTLQCGTSGSPNRCVTISSTGFFRIESGGIYIHNTDQTASTRIFNGTESFASGSWVRIQKWSSTSTPLVGAINSNFGHLSLEYSSPSLWNNNGLGSTNQILGNFIINSSTETFLDNTSSNVNISIGGKLFLYGELRVKDQGNGNTFLTVADSMIVNGGNAIFNGIRSGNGNFTFNGQHISVTGGSNMLGINNGDGDCGFATQNVTLTGASTFQGINNGIGNITFTFNNISTTSSFFYGIFNDETANAGTATFTGINIYYSDNYFQLHYGCNVENDTVSLTLTGNLDVNFSSMVSPMDDYFSFINMASFGGTPNTAALKVNIFGNMSIYGNAGDFFVSSRGAGAEIINIVGNLSVAEGTNYFNGVAGQGINGHNVTLTVGGTTSLTGGILILSTLSGNLTANFNGATTINGGTLTMKGNVGTGNVTFGNSFSFSNGTVFFYNDTAVSNDVVTTNVNGPFTHNGGVINFCNNTKSGGATNVLNLNGSSVSFGLSGNITRGLAGTGSVFGMINYKRVGSMNYNRTAGSAHDIQQVKQNVSNGTTLNASANIQVASNATAGVDFFTVSNGGILNLSTRQLFSNQTAANSGISVLSGGKLRTQHSQGLYNNSSLCAISNLGNMDYSLDPNSTVEIYGTGNKVLTGIGLGLATATQHKYGILEINHSSGDTTYVYPTSSPSFTTTIYIRTQLKLTAGELNLINSLTPVATGGRTITIENSSTSAITRTAGFIKSEAQNFSGLVKWETGSTTGNFVIPFGYNSSNYIPTTFDVSSGAAGTAQFATYHTAANNLPWPQGVNNLNSTIGLTPDNRDATTDRYWYSNYSGVATAALTLRFALSELPISPYDDPNQLNIHRYNTSSLLWEWPGGQNINAPNGVSVYYVQPGVGIWAMASVLSPLPIELLSFEAVKHDDNVALHWSTASEKDNDYFVIERSSDLKEIKEIGRVDGAGNSITIKRYSLIDREPIEGASYYRLRQFDINGDNSVSDWVKIKFNLEGNIVLYPNPAGDYIFVDGVEQDEVSDLMITDIFGNVRVLYDKPSSLKVDISDLNEGAYILKLVLDNSKAINRPFIINR